MPNLNEFQSDSHHDHHHQSLIIGFDSHAVKIIEAAISGGKSNAAALRRIEIALAEILAAVKAGGQGMGQAQIDQLFTALTGQKAKLDAALTDSAKPTT